MSGRAGIARTVAFGAVLAFGGVLALTGCTGSPDDPEGGFSANATIGVALPQPTSQNWEQAESLFSTGLTDAGFAADVQVANAGISEQQKQIDSMIDHGARVIIVGAVDGSQLGTQLERAHSRDILVIAFDRLLTGTDYVDLYVAYDPFQVGVQQGESLIQGLHERRGEQPTWNIELVAGAPDDANAHAFFNGAMSVLQPEIDAGAVTVLSGHTTFDQVATTSWLAEYASQRMDLIIAGFYSHGTALDGVLAPNDALARAVLTATASAGLEAPVVTGQDAEPESVRSIMEGAQYSTVYKDTAALVEESVRQITLAQQGSAFEAPDVTHNGATDVPTVFLDPVIVTQNNAAEVLGNIPILAPIIQQFDH
ncbi:MAG: sugar-binding protein [Cellulomonadaceae bacterium]|jgi:putative multiple sugar transport system substrate-binding protein|nr:sugar-binding protein [Cellulomonadaceae bacterium]